MIKQHLWVFAGGIAVGYFMSNKLVAYQPWKLTYNLVVNL